MIRIQELKLRPDHTPEMLEEAIRERLHLSDTSRFTYTIRRRSVDARRRPDIFYSYTIDVHTKGEERILRSLRRDRHVTAAADSVYAYAAPMPGAMERARAGAPADGSRPVIVGSGPAGLFCALLLARAGRAPIVLEQGRPVRERLKVTEHFWKNGELDEHCNVQFGEGGAGTFSDGKLNTSIKDPGGRIRYVLKTFVRMGADEKILYDYRPHIGSDALIGVVENLREAIISLGGRFCFNRCLTGMKRLHPSDGTGEGRWLLSVLDVETGAATEMEAPQVVLAIGHSARHTIRMLCDLGLPMRSKPFAVGVRIQHPQEWIDAAMYGPDCPYTMDPAPYKLTHRLGEGRGVYSFCMCPGGYVVNASSAPGHLAVNGMSYHDRGGVNANSAIVCTVDERDYGRENVLGGLIFQQKLEQAAFRAGEGAVPVQRFEDFERGIPSREPGRISLQCRGTFRLSRVDDLFGRHLRSGLIEGIHAFTVQIPGFDDPDAWIAGVESRTSSPVRIERGADLTSPGFPGVYPCGEGAGYAGGIVSAATDGLRVAEAIIEG